MTDGDTVAYVDADGPQYSLDVTLRKINGWLESPDPYPPDDLIELMVAARYWLAFFKSGSETLAKAAEVVGRLT